MTQHINQQQTDSKHLQQKSTHAYVQLTESIISNYNYKLQHTHKTIGQVVPQLSLLLLVDNSCLHREQRALVFLSSDLRSLCFINYNPYMIFNVTHYVNTPANNEHLL